jgi:hypothetical protein
VTSGVITAVAVETAAGFCDIVRSGNSMYGQKLQSSLSVLANTLIYLPLSSGYREQDTQKHRHISTRPHGVIIQTLGIFSSFEVFALTVDIPSNVEIPLLRDAK